MRAVKLALACRLCKGASRFCWDVRGHVRMHMVVRAGQVLVCRPLQTSLRVLLSVFVLPDQTFSVLAEDCSQ